MTREEIARTVASIIAAVLKQPVDTGDDICRANVDTWDSLKHVQIMLTIEESLDVQFGEEELSELDSLDAIVAAVAAYHAA
jgi:acyl carrier protein